MLSIYNPDNLEKWMHTNSTNTTVDERQCAICFEELADKTALTTLECTHSFCTSCILRWFQTNNTCPCCRAEVPNVVPSRGGRNRRVLIRRRRPPHANSRYSRDFLLHLLSRMHNKHRKMAEELRKWRTGERVLLSKSLRSKRVLRHWLQERQHFN